MTSVCGTMNTWNVNYTAMNSADRYVVDNYRLFERGVASDDIDIKGYCGKISLSRLLMKTCNHTRVRPILYLNTAQRTSKAKSEKVSVYTIKSRAEIKEYLDVTITYTSKWSKMITRDLRRVVDARCYIIYDL